MSTDTLTIRTNHVPRFTLDAYELTAKQREDFEYLDWDAIDRGEDSATFVQYLGTVYDLGEFERTNLPGWDGQQTDTFFSATLVRYCEDGESVIMGRVYT